MDADRDSCSPDIIEEKVVIKTKKEGTAKKSFIRAKNVQNDESPAITSPMGSSARKLAEPVPPNIWVESVESLAPGPSEARTKINRATRKLNKSNNALGQAISCEPARPSHSVGISGQPIVPFRPPEVVQQSTSNGADDSGEIEILEERPPRYVQQQRAQFIITTRPVDSLQSGTRIIGGPAAAQTANRAYLTQTLGPSQNNFVISKISPNSSPLGAAWKHELSKTYAPAVRSIDHGNYTGGRYSTQIAPQTPFQAVYRNPGPIAVKSLSIPRARAIAPNPGQISMAAHNPAEIEQSIDAVLRTQVPLKSSFTRPVLPYSSVNQEHHQMRPLVGIGNGVELQQSASVTVKNTQPLNIGQLLHSDKDDVHSPSIATMQGRSASGVNSVPLLQQVVQPPTRNLKQVFTGILPKSSTARGTKQPAKVVAISQPLPLNPNLPKHPQEFYARGTSGKPWNDRRGDDSEFRGQFKCEWCDARFPTNVAFSNHALAHFLHEPCDPEDEESASVERVVSASLADTSRCTNCFAVFRTPFDLENHIQAVHLRHKSVELQGQNCVCYICEKSFSNIRGLMGHMHNVHKDGPEAPYCCKICQFRSSFYEDVVYHFQKLHGESRSLLCLVCLHVIEAQLPKVVHKKRTTVVNTRHFVNHMMQHVMQKNTKAMTCQRCRLSFVKDLDKSKHDRAHMKVSFDTRHTYGMKRVKCSGYRPKFFYEDENRLLLSRRLKRPVDRPLTLAEARCVECHQPMNSGNHFRAEATGCSLCEFQSTCNNSFVNHMIDHAKGLEGNPTVFRKSEPIMRVPGQCQCGFTTTLGSKLAHHLNICEDSTGTVKLIPVITSSNSQGEEAHENLVRRPCLEQMQNTVLPKKFLRHARLAAKYREKEFQGQDSEQEDEQHMEQKLDEIRNRKKNRCLKIPSPAPDDSSVYRPHLMSPKMMKQRSAGGSAKTTPKKMFDSGPFERRAKRKRKSSDSDSDDSNGESSVRLSEFKRKKLDEVERDSADPFLSRRATADQAGSDYKNYRDKASKLEAELTGHQDDQDLGVHIGSQASGKETLESILLTIDVSSVLKSLLDQVAGPKGFEDRPKERRTARLKSSRCFRSSSADGKVTPDSEAALAETNNNKAEVEGMDYEDFVKEMATESEENKEVENPGENSLFERIEKEIQAAPISIMET